MKYWDRGMSRLLAVSLAMLLQAEAVPAESIDEGTFRVRYVFLLHGKLLSHAEITCNQGKICPLFTDQNGVELSLRSGRNGDPGTVEVRCGATDCGFAFPRQWSKDDRMLKEFVVLERSPSDFGQELVIRIRRPIGSVILKFAADGNPSAAGPDIKL